jgi:hypothetical protein
MRVGNRHLDLRMFGLAVLAIVALSATSRADDSKRVTIQLTRLASGKAAITLCSSSTDPSSCKSFGDPQGYDLNQFAKLHPMAHNSGAAGLIAGQLLTACFGSWFGTVGEYPVAGNELGAAAPSVAVVAKQAALTLSTKANWFSGTLGTVSTLSSASKAIDPAAHMRKAAIEKRLQNAAGELQSGKTASQFMLPLDDISSELWWASSVFSGERKKEVTQDTAGILRSLAGSKAGGAN